MKSKIAYIFCSLMFLLFISSCDKDSDTPIVPDNPVAVEMKQESLPGNWALGREDNGAIIVTSLEIKADKTCVYTQTIKLGQTEADADEVNKFSLKGRWTANVKANTLTFDLSDDNGNAISLSANVETDESGSVTSFKIDDAYSADDNFCFTR